MVNKTIFITVDFEEWYHITYLDKYHFAKNEIDTCADKVFQFFQKLSRLNIHATVFVVAEIVNENIEILKKIKKLGHEIACHGQSHKILSCLSDEDFYRETKQAKQCLEESLETEVIGYRAPSFSLTNSKLDLLKKIGFKYDSSYITFKENEYSETLDLSSYSKVTTNIYQRDGFFEFEMPYANLFGLKKSMGGGFFRLYPLWFFKIMVKKYLRNNDSLVFFIHPYEISGAAFSKNSFLNLKDKIRLNLNRKGATKKFFKFIEFARKKGYTFSTFNKIAK